MVIGSCSADVYYSRPARPIAGLQGHRCLLHSRSRINIPPTTVLPRAWQDYYRVMLLRWLVQNYLREAAEGKVREVVSGVVQRDPQKRGPADEPAGPAPMINTSTSVFIQRSLWPQTLRLCGLGL